MVPYISYFPFPSPLSKKPEDTLIDITAISVHFLKKHYGEAHLITCQYGADLFKGVGFTTIDLELEKYANIFNQYDEIWSLSKLYAYIYICEKNKPFLHIDNDVFLLEPLPKELLEKGIFAQNEEVDGFNFYEMEIFYENCPNKYFMEKRREDIAVANLGIFGGKDVSFIKDYAQSALRLVLDKENESFWRKQKFPEVWQKAAIAEQYSLTQYARNLNKNIYFLKDFKTEDGYKNEYSHLMNRKFIPNFNSIIKDLRSKII